MVAVVGPNHHLGDQGDEKKAGREPPADPFLPAAVIQGEPDPEHGHQGAEDEPDLEPEERLPGGAGEKRKDFSEGEKRLSDGQPKKTPGPPADPSAAGDNRPAGRLK